MSTDVPTTGGPRTLGRYVVVDPAICHGQPTFRGSRILVADVLDQVARGMAWEAIIENWHGRLTRAAITEAVQLATESFLNHADEFVADPSSV